MVYFKLLLNDKRLKSDNIYPIAVRVTYNRTNTTFTTGIRVNRNLWDEKSYKIKHSHPNAQKLNKTISDFYNKVQNASLKLIDEQSFSLESLKERLSEGQQPPKIIHNQDFNIYASELIKDLFSINKAGNAIIYRTATNRLMGYAGKSTLKFTEINYSFLDGFKRHLMKDGVKQNSISNYFRTIRAIYNKAIKAKLVDRSQYPFLDISIKTERTAKRSLRMFDLVKLGAIELKTNTPLCQARNYFFLSFTLMGVSFTDLAYLKRANIKGERLIYRRKKTGQELNIKLQPYTSQLIDTFIKHEDGYLLPILQISVVEGSIEAKKVISQWIKTTNKYLDRLAKLCDIDAAITTYVTRHSWATTAKRLGYSNEMIAEGLGHEHGYKITNIYLDRFDNQLIDQMNDIVIINIIPCIKEVPNKSLFFTKLSVNLNEVLSRKAFWKLDGFSMAKCRANCNSIIRF